MRPSLEITLMSALMLAGCATAVGVTPHLPQGTVPVPSLAIARVSVDPKTIDVRQQAVATIRYHLTHLAAVAIDVVDEKGRVVRQLDAGQPSAGMQQISWDGRTNDGLVVPDGVYRYIIHAHDRAGRHPVYDPSGDTGGEELQPRDFTFDQRTGRMQWVMPRAGRARLRVGIQGFPHLRTLLDWEPLEAGEQAIVWDGRDASGFIQAIAHPNLSVKLSAFALPDNTVIVRGESASGVALSLGSATYPPEQKSSVAYLHARHPRAVCHETRLSIEFPAGTRTDDRGRPLLTGTVPVRVIVDPRDASHLVNSRFEVALYEDLTFLFEEEESVNPFTFLWDTTRLTSGEHLLTVNVLSYDDHYGVVTQPVVIEERS